MVAAPSTASAKDLRVVPIACADARRIVRALHYSGKVVNNSTIHLGVFLHGRCGGALQFGSPLDRRKLLGVVRGTKWNEMIELNRMALADWLPRNSESRVLGFTMRWLRKTYPWLKWVVSFADAGRCGDGTIYRAAGFVLTGIVENTGDFVRFADGSVKHKMALHTDIRVVSAMRGAKLTGGKATAVVGGEVFPSWSMRYIYFLDPAMRAQLVAREIPYAEIAARGLSMYKGERSRENAAAPPRAEGGVIPTRSLQPDPA
jgi:hypothetical protein